VVFEISAPPFLRNFTTHIVNKRIFNIYFKPQVGSLTNHYETECLSTHLTSFAGGFIVLPSPINWSYVFANAGFLKNKTVYLTIICTSIIYLILIIYARFKDKKDIEKVN